MDKVILSKSIFGKDGDFASTNRGCKHTAKLIRVFGSVDFCLHNWYVSLSLDTSREEAVRELFLEQQRIMKKIVPGAYAGYGIGSEGIKKFKQALALHEMPL
jgi:hypothetical protein